MLVMFSQFTFGIVSSSCIGVALLIVEFLLVIILGISIVCTPTSKFVTSEGFFISMESVIVSLSINDSCS
jgi:hypothetical protein